MDHRIFLQRYRLSRGRNGLPVELYRSPAARTYRAQEIETGREVALTLASPVPNDPALLERLEAEAAAAGQINQVNIPRLYDFGRENDGLIYVTEYCEGHTAAAWVGARGPLATGAVLRVALQVVDAMNATAFQRLHHSALNPDNIVFVAGQTVEGDWPPIKVLHWYAPPPDFSVTGDERIDRAVRFAAPEQLQNGQVDVRAEIYSLGATVWFLLTGTAPGPNLPGDPKARAGLEKLRGVPRIVCHLLERMLRVNPAERPQDPVALAAYLQTCLARVERREKIERRLGVPLLARARVAAAARPRRPIPIKPLAWAAGIMALAAFAIVFLPWPLTQNRTAPVVQEPTRLPQRPPHEVAVAKNDSLGRMNETAPAVTPVPARLAATLPNDEVPRDEMAGTVADNHTPAVEPAPPAEAPDETSSAPPTVLAANSAAVPAPAETILPTAEPEEAEAVPAPVLAETNEPRDVAPPDPAPLRNEEPAQMTQSPPAAKKTSLAKRTTKKSTIASKPERTATRPGKTRRVARPARRAQPLPKLRVGSAPAELVGTTADGKWILSVAESGQHIIVPPPPGYGD